MPIISVFYGISIFMYPLDHPKPHFHARYQDCKAVYDLNGHLEKGAMPPAQDKLICQWAREHGDDLRASWHLAEQGELPHRIEPLE